MLQKAIITVVGKNKRGIIARVSSKLAEEQIDVLDITQTIIQGYFNMMMIVDMDSCHKDFSIIVDDLNVIGEELGVQIKCQLESIFDKMHRL